MHFVEKRRHPPNLVYNIRLTRWDPQKLPPKEADIAQEVLEQAFIQKIETTSIGKRLSHPSAFTNAPQEKRCFGASIKRL